MAVEQIGFEPNPGPQTWFLQSTAYELLYGGLPGGGKSEGIIIDALGLSHDPPQFIHPEYQAVIFRKEERQLAQLIRYARKYYPQFGLKETDGGKTWRLGSRDVVTFSHMHSEGDYLLWQGHNLTYVAFDEIPQFSLDQYGGIMPWVRPGAPDLTAYLRCTGNPIGPGVPWVRDRFIMRCNPYEIHVVKNEFEGETYEDTIQFIPSSFRDNKHIDKGYVGRLLRMPNPTVRDALINSDVVAAWNIVVGSFFSQFSNVTHVIGRSEERNKRKELAGLPLARIEGIDWGFRNPFCTLWGVRTPDGDVYITDEHYEKGQRIDHHARKIHEKRQKIGWEDASMPLVPFKTVADRSIFDSGPNAVLQSQMTIGQELRKRGVSASKSDSSPGSRKQGFSLIHDHLYTDGIVPPRLHIFESCNNLITEMVRAVTDDRDAEDMDSSSPDHALDCLRYMLMHLNLAHVQEKVQETEENSWQNVFDALEKPSDNKTYARGNAA
jgi:hypothetical protein